MKKTIEKDQYSAPECMVVVFETHTVLCVSGDIAGGTIDPWNFQENPVTF